MSNQFRPVNRAVGLAPKLGTFAFYQVVPVLGMAIGVYYLKVLVGFSWIVAALVWGLMTGIILALLGNKPWLFFSRTMKVPNLVRGGANYNPLLTRRTRNPQRRQKRKGRRQ